MSSSYKLLKPVLAELSVTISKEDIAKALDKAYGDLSRTARIRGFRKGKAPRSVLQRLYGNAVLQNVQSDIVNSHLLQALLENELDPISQPNLDLSELKLGEDYHFSATFEVRPRLEKVDYSDIEVERLRVTASEEEIDKELERIRGTLAAVSDLPEPRPAAEGDVAIITMKRWVEGKWEDSPGMPPQEVIVGKGQAPKQIDEALVGMNIDEDKVVDMGSAKEIEEDRLRYLITLTALKERKLPDVDDEMAKDTGKYDSLDALKADIEKHIIEAKNRNEDQRLRSAVFEKLMDKNPVELPPNLVDRHSQALKNQLYGQLMAQMTPEQSEEMAKGLEENTRKSAERMVHQHLLTAEIARLESISVDDDDVDREIEERANAAGIPVPLLKAEVSKENRAQEFSNEILERKIFDFVKSSVKIIDVDKLSEPEPTAETEASNEATAGGKVDDKKVDATDEKEEETTNSEKNATKKTAAKKSTTVKAAAKKAVINKSTAKKTAAKKTAAKKTTAKKTATETKEE